MHFFFSIVLIVLIELAIRPLIDGLLLPLLWQSYGLPSLGVGHFRHLQMVALELGSMLLILIWSISWLIPPPFRSLAITLGQEIEVSLERVISGLHIDLWSDRLPTESALRVFGLSALLLILQLLPYLAAGIYFVFYVIRESRRIRREDEEKQKQVDQERNRMLSNIAHDIRNPITTILGYAQALDDGMVRDAQKEADYHRAIRRKAERVDRLIDILFEYAKLNSSGFSLKKEPLDVCECLRQNAALLYSDAEEAGMELIPEIPNEAAVRSIDRLQFSRIITNLVTNSIRYNPKGTKILIRYIVDPDGWRDDRLVIADSGDAIDPEMAGRLFEPFSRGDASRPTDGGSGLGLSIVKSIVELHGGRISYCAEVEGYTKGFLIELPRR